MNSIYIGDTDIDAIWQIDKSLYKEAEKVSSSISNLMPLFPLGWPIGLERYLYGCQLPDVSEGVICRTVMISSDYLSIIRPELMLRPPIEYGVINLFQIMNVKAPIIDDVQHSVKLMGGDSHLRNSPATSFPFEDGKYTQYMNPEDGLPVLKNLLSSIIVPANRDNALLRAIEVYMKILVCHCFQDGNGRLARALFQCVLKTELGVNVPVFPLAPFFECNKHLLINAKMDWEIHADPSPLVKLFINIIESLCDMHRTLLRF